MQVVWTCTHLNKMEILSTLLQYEFLQRALITGLFLGVLYAFLGTYTVIKKMAFFADGIAHASLLGIAIGIAVQKESFFFAMGIALLFGLLVYILEKKTTVANDVVISLLFTAGLSGGIIILSLIPGYKPDILSYLFGNILTITQTDYYLIIASSLAFLTYILLHRAMLFLSFFDPVEARLRGIPVARYELSFYILLSLAVILGVKMLGVVLVSALLVIPSFVGFAISPNFRSLFAINTLIAVIMIVTGICLSFLLNLPAGATIVLTGTVIVLWVLLYRKFLG